VLHPATTIFLVNPFVFNKRLKRKDFQEMALLAWAQEVPGSNPGARPKYPAISFA
jgi:hypothetical protein